MDELLNTTYAIRMPGCAARYTGVSPSSAQEMLAIANSYTQGHVVLAESGPMEGRQVDVADIEESLAAARGGM